MLLMASEGLGIRQVAAHFRESSVWQFLSYQVDHAAWQGCALWDLIQPSFSFMVGVATPFSLAVRRAKGDTFRGMLRHAVVRSLMLVALGVFLRSANRSRTNFTFEDTLSQIGLGYTFLFLIAHKPPRTQAIAAAAILLATWAAFALYPLPGPDFDPRSVGVVPDWPFRLSGFARHWDKNTNFAAAFDQWFLNLFPREAPFVYNNGGYLTLSFVPTLATMILGLLAGNLLRARPGKPALRALLAAGVAGLVVGTILDLTGICPSVKRIWTPAWVIFSGGWCCLLLAAFYQIVDLRGRRRWAFPLVIVGMNSIAMYCMAQLWEGFVRGTFRTHLGKSFFENLAGPYAPLAQGVAVLLVLWLLCLWMYRRKIFLRI
jgi:predicted acyltransferase